MKQIARLLLIPLLCIGLLTPIMMQANQSLQKQIQILAVIMERIRALKTDDKDDQERQRLALLLNDLTEEIDNCYKLLGIARNLVVDDNAQINTLNVTGAAQFGSTITLPHQTLAAGSYQTATRLEWARVNAKGALLNNSNGVHSVTRTKVGTYQVILAPALDNPAIITTAASPQIVANYTTVTSNATQTIITVSTNGIDAEFGIIISGLQ